MGYYIYDFFSLSLSFLIVYNIMIINSIKVKYNKKITIFLSILLFISVALLVYFINVISIKIFILTFSNIIISLLFKINIKNYYIFIIVFDFINYIYFIIYKTIFFNILYINYHFFLSYFLYNCVINMIIFLIISIYRNIKMNNAYIQSMTYGLLVLIVMSSFFESKNVYSISFSISVFILYFFYFLLLIKNILYKKNIHKIQMEKEYEKKINYLSEIINKQKYTNKELHDIRNELYAIKYDINNSKSLGRINELLEITNESSQVTYVNNITIDSLIHDKRKLMNKYCIKFKCDCYTSNFEFINNNDFCRIIGNLLDNAIEATIKVENKKIILSFRQVNNYLNIIVKNTYDKNNIDYGSTSKPNYYQHGFGIKNVKEIITKYQGKMIIDAKDYFIVSIILLNK